MQTLLRQLRAVAPERAQALLHKGRVAGAPLRRELKTLDTVPHKGKHSNQANLYLLLQALGAEPKLDGASWLGAQLVYPRERLIGHGTFANVYACEQLAIKQLKAPSRDRREVEVLQRLTHRNIVQLKDH